MRRVHGSSKRSGSLKALPACQAAALTELAELLGNLKLLLQAGGRQADFAPVRHATSGEARNQRLSSHRCPGCPACLWPKAARPSCAHRTGLCPLAHLACEGGPRALLAVTKGGVKDAHIVWIVDTVRDVFGPRALLLRL